MRMCDKTYNVLKWMAQLLLPAMGTLYFALASIWRLPYGSRSSAPLPRWIRFSV